MPAQACRVCPPPCYGYMLEYPIARFYADARVQKIYGGANEIMKELIARGLE